MLGPERCKVDILAYFPPAVHLYGLALQLRQLEFDGGTGVSGWDLKLEFELVSDEVVGGGAHPLPFGAFLVGLYFEPVVILFLVGLDVADDGLQLFPETLLPLGVARTCMDGEEWYFGGSLLD